MIAAFLSLASIAIGLFYTTHDFEAGWTYNLLGGVAITILFVALGSLLVLASGRVANWISVDEGGFTVDYGHGRLWTVPWTNPNLKIVIGKGSPSMRGVPNIQLVGHFYQRAHLSEEASDELVRQATSRGLQVRNVVPAGNPSAVLTTIFP